MAGLTPQHRRCVALRLDGKRCQGFAASDGDLCIAHDPEMRAKAESARVAGGLATRKPGVVETMRERVDAAVDAILKPYFDTLGVEFVDGAAVLTGNGAKLTATYQGEVSISDIDDAGAQIEAAEKLLDRVYGKPKQVSELTGAGGAPLVITLGDVGRSSA